jgi:ribonuclease HI
VYQFIIIFDGGGNANVQTYGSYLIKAVEKKGERIIEFGNQNFNVSTSNEAEYVTLETAIKRLLEILEPFDIAHKSRVRVWGDSELVIEQLNGRYKVRAKNLAPFYYSIKSMEIYFLDVVYKWHNRKNSLEVFGH